MRRQIDRVRGRRRTGEKKIVGNDDVPLNGAGGSDLGPKEGAIALTPRFDLSAALHIDDGLRKSWCSREATRDRPADGAAREIEREQPSALRGDHIIRSA